MYIHARTSYMSLLWSLSCPLYFTALTRLNYQLNRISRANKQCHFGNASFRWDIKVLSPPHIYLTSIADVLLSTQKTSLGWILGLQQWIECQDSRERHTLPRAALQSLVATSIKENWCSSLRLLCSYLVSLGSAFRMALVCWESATATPTMTKTAKWISILLLQAKIWFGIHAGYVHTSFESRKRGSKHHGVSIESSLLPVLFKM